MDKKTAAAVIGAALAGAALVVSFDAMDGAEAAPGDITPQTPKTDTGLSLEEICFRQGTAVYRWSDGFGRGYEAVVKNGTSTGFNYATGEKTSVATPGLFTTVRGSIGITNAKVTTSVTDVRTAGVIVLPGSIQ